MKTLIMNKGIWLMVLTIFISTSVFAMPKADEELIDTVNFKAYYGKVIDSQSSRTLPFATIEAIGSNIATVSNIDGEFTNKINKEADVSDLKFSYICLRNKTIQ